MTAPAAQQPLPDGPHSHADLSAREDAIRAAAAAWARQWVGTVANPTAGDGAYARYCALIAPGETAQMREAMSRMSGCALFARAYLRAVLRDTPRCLTLPYVVGHAVSDVHAIALAAGAVCAPGTVPRVGDVVRVTSPEHVYIVTAVEDHGDGSYGVTSVDGGQRAPGGWQSVEERARALSIGPRVMTDRVVGGALRTVASVYDLGAMLRRYGCAEEMTPDSL